MGDAPVSESADCNRYPLAALLLLVPAPSIGVVCGAWLLKGPTGSLVWALSKGWILLLPLAWWLAVDRRPIRISPPRKGGFGLGLLSGLGMALGIVGCYWLFAHRWVEPEIVRKLASEVGSDRKPVYLALAAYLTFVNSLLEEYVWRWFVYTKARELIGPRWAPVAAGFLFTVHHVLVLAAQFPLPIVLLGSAGVFVGGLTWSALYQRYGSVWPGYLSHILADIGVLYVGWCILFR